ncbi:MAG: hypothetical protein GF393_05795, partial [Armatimonadia bacterium]|nr:hypothetical protein [Armatimonadia bacterium]
MNEARVAGIRRVVALLAGLMIISTAYAEEMKPPLLQIGQTHATVDGRIGADEWASAGELGVLVGRDGLPATTPARVRAGWNADGLVVLWTLTGEPTFRRRERDAEIWRDDAVEVRLRS